jgi:hypothetical protein
VNIACPFASVVALTAWTVELSELDERLTVSPIIGFPAASFTVTVTVVVATLLSSTVEEVATTVEVPEETAPATTSIDGDDASATKVPEETDFSLVAQDPDPAVPVAVAPGPPCDFDP